MTQLDFLSSVDCVPEPSRRVVSRNGKSYWETRTDMHHNVFMFMRIAARQGKWLTVSELAKQVDGHEQTISARIRDLRKPSYGGNEVFSRRRQGGNGEFEYLLKASPLGILRLERCQNT